MEPLELFTRREVLSVGELVGRVKRLTEQTFDFVWVRGEVSGLRRPGSGHLYFSLKDEGASLRAVLFRHQAALLRFALEEGRQVLCQGRISLYAPRGDLQLVVDTVEPLGEGALALAFEQTKRRLQDDGLLDAERKRPLPGLPRRVAVVTSPTGAAIRDFLNVLHRRFPGIEVTVYPVRVQGEQAAPQMIAALDDLAGWDWPEVVVLTRGGGSPEDLWAFNDEGLARAVARSPVPVVSAVGHEVDVTICDLVADLRAPTPSAAAELLAKSREHLAARLNELSTRLGRLGRGMVAERRRELGHLRRGLVDPRRRLADRRLRVDELLMRVRATTGERMAEARQGLLGARGRLMAVRPDLLLERQRVRLRGLEPRLFAAGALAVTGRRAELEHLAARLRDLGPLSVLSRGFSVVTDERGRVLRGAEQARAGMRVLVRLHKGRLAARVEEVNP